MVLQTTPRGPLTCLTLSKIKCDEKFPSCENCAKFGCPCPGYQQRFRWSHKHQPVETSIFHGTSTGRDDQPGDTPAIGQVVQAGRTNTQAQSTLLQNAPVLGSSQHALISMGDDCDLDWLTEVPSTWPATDLDIGAEHVQEASWSSHCVVNQSGMSGPQHQLVPLPNTRIVQAPVQLSSTLIEYWFRHICPVRSTFDSNINNNRTLPRNSWATSEAVFYTMQVMSAACLADAMPQVAEALPSLREQATLAITQGISQVRNLRVARVTADLVFAVLAMGTSSHWVHPGNSNHPWLQLAHELLSIWTDGMLAADALLHAYFRQALAYWEMLLTVVGRGSNSSGIDKRRRKYRDRLRRTMFLEADDLAPTIDEHQTDSSSLKPLGTLPNSWCGVSNEVIEVFGQVMALCRSVCDYDHQKTSMTLDSASQALCDIAVANELAKELLSMDFDTIVLLEEVQGFYIVETRDDNTPISHLLQTAEAYRKAGLLQLYLTFDDLPVKTTTGRDDVSTTTTTALPAESIDKESRSRSLVDMALQLVATLEDIPVESGSKFIHPMLYLSAAVGLRFDMGSRGSHGSEFLEDINGGPDDISICQADWSLLDATQPESCAEEHSDALATFIPQSILKIAEARRLVWSRLSMIRRAVPYKASDSLLRLVKTVWSEYDKPHSDTSSMIWLKILSQSGLDMLL